MSRRRKHRLWTIEEKRSICLQARTPGVSVAQVARRYALNSNLVFKWLKDPRFAPSAAALDEIAEGSLSVPVDVMAEPALPAVSTADRPVGDRRDGEIEIVLVCGHRVKVRGAFDGDALARLLKSLADR